MYKVSEEYLGQNVVANLGDNVFITLENASQVELAKCYKVKGLRKFIDFKRTK